VTTTNTLVTSAGTNDFAVGYDPASNRTIVQCYAGSISVQPAGSPISITLEARRQVTVTGHLAGPVTVLTSYLFAPSISKPAPGVVPPQPQPCTPSPAGESNNIADVLTVCSGQAVSGRVSDGDRDDVYQLRGEAGQQVTVVLAGTGGDADLYIFAPGAGDVTTDPSATRSVTVGNDEFVQFVLPASGDWYIDVYADAGTTDYTMTATLSSPGTAAQATAEATANVHSSQ
jgi:hypothetical protein